MTPQELEVLLAKTLEDRSVSGNEKRVLSQILSDASLDNHRRNVLRNRAFSLAREAIADPKTVEVIQWLEEINKLLLPRSNAEPESSSDVCFSPGPDCARRIIGLLSNSRRSAELCVFTIADDRISDAILAAHRRGIAVRIISDDGKSHDAGSDIEKFQRAGIAVRLDSSPDHMHHKFALFDRTVLANGSFNWTRSASEYNQENLVVISDEKLVKAFAAEFDRLWDHV